MKNNIPKNILSYVGEHAFTGKEIKEWIIYNLKNNTSKTNVAHHMKKYLNIEDDELYVIVKNTYSSCAEYNKFELIKVTKNNMFKNKQYEKK